MVTDKHNKIYTDLVNHMKSIYPTLISGTTYKEKPQLPYMYFYQIDASTMDVTLSNTEESVNLAFQIEIYTDMGTNMARKMSYDIRSHMIENGFRCKAFLPIQTFSNVSRFVARYERRDV